MVALSALAQQPPAPRTLVPSIIKVGKWAEGMAFDGTALWVAESGQRSIVRLAQSGAIVRYENVGRLPVSLASPADGRVYALIQTDQIVWQPVAGSTKGRAVKWIADCPQGLAADAQMLWVLTWPGCSSTNSRVVRLNPTTGAEAQTASLGEWGQAITTSHGKVWVAHVRGGRLDAIDPLSLTVDTTIIQGASLWALATNRTALFSGGRMGDDNERGLIVSIDPKSRREINRLLVGGLITTMTADDESLAAISDSGTIHVVSTKDFTLKSVITLSVGTYRPSSALILDDKLVIVAQEHQGENGAVFTVSDWR
jgi:DNA-binding beta-propeller fold protein YncE